MRYGFAGPFNVQYILRGYELDETSHIGKGAMQVIQMRNHDASAKQQSTTALPDPLCIRFEDFDDTVQGLDTFNNFKASQRVYPYPPPRDSFSSTSQAQPSQSLSHPLRSTASYYQPHEQTAQDVS